MILHSKIQGQGARANGESSEAKPLLILHGFLGMSDNWKTLASQYAENNFQVHAIDLRNHGKSFHSSDFSYEFMVQDVVDYCNSHQLQSIDILGHSMGGKVVMLLATTHPELVNKLIVADIGPKFYPPHHQTILASLNAVDFSEKPSRSEVETIMLQYISDFGTRQFLLKNLYWKEPDQLAFRFNLPVFNQKIDEIGKALPFENHFDQPTLFLRGDQSDYILDSDFENIMHHFPKAIIQTIHNAGHWLHVENPSEFFNKTISFLNN
jgi:esterase